MSKDEDAPRARLIQRRRECDLGIAAAEACMGEDLIRPYEAFYRNRQVWWLTTRDAVDRALAALEETHD